MSGSVSIVSLPSFVSSSQLVGVVDWCRMVLGVLGLVLIDVSCEGVGGGGRGQSRALANGCAGSARGGAVALQVRVF